MSYPITTECELHEPFVLVFADASLPNKSGQIGILVGVLIDKPRKGSIFHAVSWKSHKA